MHTPSRAHLDVQPTKSVLLQKSDLEHAVRAGVLGLEDATRLWKHLRHQNAGKTTPHGLGALPTFDAQDILRGASLVLAAAAAMCILFISWGQFGPAAVAGSAAILVALSFFATIRLHAAGRSTAVVFTTLAAMAMLVVTIQWIGVALDLRAFQSYPTRDVFGPVPVSAGVREIVLYFAATAYLLFASKRFGSRLLACLAYFAAFGFASESLAWLLSQWIPYGYAKGWSCVVAAVVLVMLARPHNTPVRHALGQYAGRITFGFALAVCAHQMVAGHLGGFWVMIAALFAFVTGITRNDLHVTAAGIIGFTFAVVYTTAAVLGYGLAGFMFAGASAIGTYVLALNWGRALKFVTTFAPDFLSR